MDAQIINGKEIAAQLTAQLTERVVQYRAAGKTVTLAVTIVGDNPASISYIRAKKRACAAVGIETFDTHFDADISQNALLQHIDTLNRDDNVNGILVQLPLPNQIDAETILQAVHPQKDVDGFHPHNMGLLVSGAPCIEPCTPKGIVHLLLNSNTQIAGAHVVVVGRSTIVGKPLALMLLRKEAGGNATVTVCHSASRAIGEITKQADILIVAVGSARCITKDMVKAGAVVIDVGVNRIPDNQHPKGYALCGDVDFDSVAQIAGKISPVPGGVGPLTIAMLLQNTVEVAERQERAAQ